MDAIIIKNLEVYYHIGVTERERAIPQRLLLTVEMGLDLSAAAAADDLARTVDYDALTQRLLHLGKDRQWQLIETLAAEIATLVLEHDRVQTATVEVKKYCLPQTRHVSVRLTRARD